MGSALGKWHCALRKARSRLLNCCDPPVMVLLYHRVNNLENDLHQLAVSPPNFRAHLHYLRDNYPVLRFEDNWSNIDKPSVVITFDDSYADNALEALPILEDVGVPVTFFISTGNIGVDQEFWWDDLERLISAGVGDFFELHDYKCKHIWQTSTSAQRKKMHDECHALMMRIDHNEREHLLRQLRDWAGLEAAARATHRVMTVKELQSLAESPLVTIGAHTVSHSSLGALSHDRQFEEIATSQRLLELSTGKKVDVFSYPFGGEKDYSSVSIRICKQLGFRKAAANFPGQVHKWTDQFQLPRCLVRNWNVEEFAAQLSRYWYV